MGHVEVNDQQRQWRAIMNTSGRSVRKRASARPAVQDRRVRRTQQALTRALVALIGERRYESITIQDLLDRADVGRSTFYAHYRGKDDFLLRTFESLIDQIDRCISADDPRIAPVRELFSHVGTQREFHRALVRAHMLDRVYQAGIERMGAAIATRLVERAGSTEGPVPPLVTARAWAGAVFSLMRWWLEQESPMPAEHMDEMFHRIIAGDVMGRSSGSRS